MADGGFGHEATVTRRIDGALMVFQRLDGLWMIDRLGVPANERGDDAGGDEDECDEPCARCDEDRATAIGRDEIEGLDGDELRAFHARQLRKLGLHAGSTGASALWRILTDFERFDPRCA